MTTQASPLPKSERQELLPEESSLEQRLLAPSAPEESAPEESAPEESALEQSQEHLLEQGPQEQDCLSEDVILAFQRGETTGAERHHIHAHLDACERCRGLVLLATRLGETGTVDTQNSSQRLAAFIDDGFRWMKFAVGKRLSERFDILRFVRRGGMGEVYEAYDRVVGSRVALKTLLSTTAESAHALAGLCQEVNLARRVAHPHVCRIYDLHEHREGGRAMRFLAMEFVEGETLKDRVLAGSLAIDEACAIGCQLLLGLGSIHAAGVLHLDFKSQNVMLRSGMEPARAVVMDFSLSRAFDKELLLKTNERHLAGSIGYMSPEQLECQATLGPSSDVYAFGVVLFEMLTGHLPFEGESPASIMLKQLKSRPPAPSSLRPGISAALDSFVLTCLSRQPRGRFQGVDATLSELRQCLASGSTRPRTAARRRHAALVTGVAAVCAVLASASRSAPPARVLQRAQPALEAPNVQPAREAAVREAAVLEPPPALHETALAGSASPLPSEPRVTSSATVQPPHRATPIGRRAPASERAEAAIATRKSTDALSRAEAVPRAEPPPAPAGAASNPSPSDAPASAGTPQGPAVSGPAQEPRAPAWRPQHAPDFLL